VTLPARVAELIATLGLQPHPEGGYYREIFRSALAVAPADGRGARAALTTIYFLLPPGAHSRWHRVASDEAWHLYEGGPLALLQLDADGTTLERVALGRDAAHGEVPVHVVPAHAWQAAQAADAYALVGCTVGPGFSFDDFDLLADVPAMADRLRATRPELAPLL
jgi:predicted cupin superfamily sugar epimerase